MFLGGYWGIVVPLEGPECSYLAEETRRRTLTLIC